MTGFHSKAMADAQNLLPSLQWVTPAVVAPHLEQRIFYSKAAHTDISYHIYTPKEYKSGNIHRFPVIYWLHGTGGHALEALPKVVAYFDQAMQKGEIPPSLIVFPNGMALSMWCDAKDGSVPMETVLIDELIPHVDSSFRTVTGREGRLIEGFSMGGYGAARLGFKYPELFSGLSMIAAGPLQLEFNAQTGPSNLADSRVKAMHDVYGDDPAYFLAQSPWIIAEKNAENVIREGLKIRIAVGDRDAMKGPNQTFSKHLSQLKIPHNYTLLPDITHNALDVFDALEEKNWDFYRTVKDAQ